MRQAGEEPPPPQLFTARMMLETRDTLTDEEHEDGVEDVHSLTTYMSDSEKKVVKRRISHKPPSSPRSPYLSSLSLTPRRSSLPPRGPQRGEAPRGALSSRHTWLNGQGSECDGFPVDLKLKKHQSPRSASNGVPEHRDKEDMYDEILHLKKSLQTHKLDREKMKARLLRLEEINTKREKQIEELLDPTKSSEYRGDMVDRKGGDMVIRSLKQRILKFERQSREKEDKLLTLQSELRTTNMAEMKITMETYYDEIQRLRAALEAVQSGRVAESRAAQSHSRSWSSRLTSLTEQLEHLQEENLQLREELNTEPPAGGARGYREWSKQRLLRRLVELEKRLEEGRRPAPSTRRSQSDQAVQTDQPATAKEGEVARSTAPQEEEELVLLRGRVLQLEKEREELQERLTNRELLFSSQIQPKQENPEGHKKGREEEEREEESRVEEEKEEIHVEGQTEGEGRVEEEREEEKEEESRVEEEIEKEIEKEREEEREEERVEKREKEIEKEMEKEREEEREEAASLLQRSWLRHREKDIVLVQAAMRAHLLRHTQLHTQSFQSDPSSDVTSPMEEEMEVAMTLIQSVFRGHLARSGLGTESSTGPPQCNNGPVPLPKENFINPSEDVHRQKDTWPVPFRLKLTPAQLEVHHLPTPEVATTMDSDDSDDIIISPTRPLRRREELLT